MTRFIIVLLLLLALPVGADSVSSGGGGGGINLQSSSPGVQQLGNANISGTSRAGRFALSGHDSGVGQAFDASIGSLDEALLNLQNNTNGLLWTSSTNGFLSLGRNGISSGGIYINFMDALQTSTASQIGFLGFNTSDDSLHLNQSGTDILKGAFNGATVFLDIPTYAQIGAANGNGCEPAGTSTDSPDICIGALRAGKPTVIIREANGQTGDALDVETFGGTVTSRWDANGNWFVGSTLDTKTASTLNLGTGNATAITVGRGLVTTTFVGPLSTTDGLVPSGVNNLLQIQPAGSPSGVLESTDVAYAATSQTPVIINGSVPLERLIDFDATNRDVNPATGVTITDAATLAIATAPINNGAGTITDDSALLIQSGAVKPGTGTVQNSYGLTVNAQSGATNNYAARFLGGSVQLDSGVQLGSSGASISASYRGTTTSPASVSAQSCADTAITVSGAAANAECAASSPAAALGNLSVGCYVSAAGTVQLHICNPTGGAITPPTGTYSVRVFNP